MSKSRYCQTELEQLPMSYEPLHYRTFNLPEKYRGYYNEDLLKGLPYDEHIWKMGDRLDKLAFKYLQDDKLWWIICLANNISYSLGIKIGSVLRVPRDARTILERLGMV